MFKLNKKGSLALSINAIVVVVIAFVVLGLALTLTRTIFKEAGAKIPEAIAVTALEAEPTGENPITVPETIEIKRSKTKSLSIGYYNGDPDTHIATTLDVLDCVSSDPTVTVETDTMPTITAISQDVGPSESKGYKVILTENGLFGGKLYVCTIAAIASDCTDTICEEKQFFLYVTT